MGSTHTHTHTQAKLTELYKSASADSESRVNELLSGVERLQSLLESVTQEKEQLQAQLDVEIARYPLIILQVLVHS